MFALTIALILVCSNGLIDAADSSAERTAHFECIDEKNITILTVDINMVTVKLPYHKMAHHFNLQTQEVLNEARSDCLFANETLQQFSLVLNREHKLQFDFRANTSSYYMESVTYTEEAPSNTTSGGVVEKKPRRFKLDMPDLRFTGNALKTDLQGYKCSNLTLALSSTDPQVQHKAKIELNDFMFYAFDNSKASSDMKRIHCRHEYGSSSIPMIVGGGLLAFGAVVAITYFIVRKRDNIWPPSEKARSSDQVVKGTQ